MPTKPPTILALDPGTKEIGVAVLSGAELCYYAVKTIRRRQPPQALLAEISRYVTTLIASYRPQAAEIKQTARQHSLAVYEYAPAEVRQWLCQKERATKRETAQRVAERCPELARYLKEPTKWGEMYWAHMLDAIAVGLHCWDEVYGNEDEVSGSKL
jgi:Holliday junction resolvasome RuvABC endonuclease subunit